MKKPRYDRIRVEKEFDSKDPHDPIVSIETEFGGIISQVGIRALGELDLSNRDVLLDVGIGQGRWAIQACAFCKKVIGLDISASMLSIARNNALLRNLSNIHFIKGSFENLHEEEDLNQEQINKILSVYAMHHLTDELKASSLKSMVDLLKKSPAEEKMIVLGDIMWFEDPDQYRDQWDEVFYDEGDTDFPAEADLFVKWLKPIVQEVDLIKLHPLVGLVVARI